MGNSTTSRNWKVERMSSLKQLAETFPPDDPDKFPWKTTIFLAVILLILFGNKEAWDDAINIVFSSFCILISVTITSLCLYDHLKRKRKLNLDKRNTKSPLYGGLVG